MGKSAVLKDLTGRPSGYIRLGDGNVLLRAALNAPAQLAIVYSDGSQSEYALSGDTAEQRIACDDKTVCGCYVFQGDVLLLLSDPAMRRAFERRALMQRKRDEPDLDDQREKDNAHAEKNVPEQKEIRERDEGFAQRRWPPPPCWDSARYRRGVWQEEEMRRI